MSWTQILVLAAIVVVFVLIKKAGQISADAARQHLKGGAKVIDVRNPGEYKSGHLAKSVNIPLDRIDSAIAEYEPDKTRVLLLHCQSGTRSAMAAGKLKRLGYTKAFNLGSYSRAARIVGG